LANLRPRGKWFVIDPAWHPGILSPAIEVALEAEAIPFVTANERTVRDIYLGGGAGRGLSILVASDFYLDTLWLITRLKRERAEAQQHATTHAWRCPACGEEAPGNFETCWSCGTAHPGGAQLGDGPGHD
jgi:hypothetical protein